MKKRIKFKKVAIGLCVGVLMSSMSFSLAETLKVPTNLTSESYAQMESGVEPEYLYFYGQERDLTLKTVKSGVEHFQLKSDFSSGKWGRNFDLPPSLPVIFPEALSEEEKLFNQLVSKTCVTKGYTSKIEEGSLYKVGSSGQNTIFALLTHDSKGKLTDEKRFVEATPNGQVNLRAERVFSNESYWLNKGHIFVLTKDGQVIRDLTAKKNHYLNGSEKNLGRLVQVKGETALKKMPVYLYRGFEYVCVDDLKMLGFAMKWDNGSQTEIWRYTGKKINQAAAFKTKVVYDSERLTQINGIYYLTLHADGHTLMRRTACEGLFRQ